jgi:hypothetical protein
MTAKLWVLSALIMTSLLLSCSKEKQKDLTLIPGYWGQVHQLEQLAPTSMYLLFVKPQDTYEVCVASHLVDEHPHILTEVEASIKIWGRYINRDIQTNVHQAEIVLPPANEHQDTTFSNYITTCPDADIVLGYANIDSVGLTANKYSYRTNSDGLQVAQNTQRVLFLQNPAYKQATWHSYLKATSLNIDTEELITKLLDRSEYQLLEEANQYSTLTVLMHEFGHVWGLCDMYPLAGGHTNCHPIWSKKDSNGNIALVPNATMAASGRKNPMFLHDDDIEGIRTLASRDRFNSLWADQVTFPPVTAAKESDFLFRFKNTVLSEASILFNFALYTNKPIQLQVTLKTNRGDLNYQPMKLQGPVDTNQYGLNLGFPSGANIESLRVIITNEQGDELALVDTKIK